MRIIGEVDVRKPIKRRKKIRRPDGNWFIVQFKYEKLGSFCFVCGCLGHTERFCETMFSSNDKNIKIKWGPWLREPEKRGTIAQKSSKWLRDNPTMAVEGNSSGDGDRYPNKEDMTIF